MLRILTACLRAAVLLLAGMLVAPTTAGATFFFPTTTNLTSSSTVQVGQSINLTATVSATSRTPFGNVTFNETTSGTTSLGVKALASGSASLSVPTAAVGVRSFRANYAGAIEEMTGTFFDASAGTVSVTVVKANATTTLSASTSNTRPGGAVTFTATVTGFNAGGTVTRHSPSGPPLDFKIA